MANESELDEYINFIHSNQTYTSVQLWNAAIKYSLERAVKKVLEAGLSTGHADTIDDLMSELIGEIQDSYNRGWDAGYERCAQHNNIELTD